MSTVQVSKAMSLNKFSDHCLKLILTVIFLGFVFHRMHELIDNEVGSRSYIYHDKNQTFPSLTICPYAYHPSIQTVYMGKNFTFDDLIKLPSLEQGVQIDLHLQFPYSTR